jgi:DNA topoisomerase I
MARMSTKSPTPAETLASAAALAAQMAERAGLVYVSDAMPGYRRVRVGKRFRYCWPDGKPLKSPREIDRLSRLAVPPAYEDVWLCIDPRGHIQATGRDARGRKQYRYHAGWRTLRDDAKFERMPAFAEALPRLRRRLARDLALPGLPRQKVLASTPAATRASVSRRCATGT